MRSSTLVASSPCRLRVHEHLRLARWTKVA